MSKGFSSQYKQTMTVLYITALNGFPGPFVKFVNDYLKPENILQMMSTQINREVIIIECLVIQSSNEVKTFISRTKASIAREIGKGNGTTFEKIVVPDSYLYTFSEMSKKEQFEFWSKNSAWLSLKE